MSLLLLKVNNDHINLVNGYIRNAFVETENLICPVGIDLLIAVFGYIPDIFSDFNPAHFIKNKTERTITNTNPINNKHHSIYANNAYKSTQWQVIQWTFKVGCVKPTDYVTFGIASNPIKDVNRSYDLDPKNEFPHYSSCEVPGIFALDFKEDDDVVMLLDLYNDILSFQINEKEPILVEHDIIVAEHISYYLCVQLPEKNNSVTLESVHVWKLHVPKLEPNEDSVSWINCHSFSTQCPLCDNNDTIFDNMYAFKHHFKTHFENNVIKKCYMCDIPLFDREMNCVYHILAHLDIKPYKCGVIIDGKRCDAEYTKKENCCVHCNKHYEIFDDFERFSSTDVRYITPSSNTATWMNTHHVSGVCPNVSCNTSHQSYDTFKGDIKDCFYDYSIGEYVCDKNLNPKFCNKSMKALGNFIEHLYSHLLSNGPYVCDVLINEIKCNHQSASKSKSLKHFNSHYTPSRN